MSRRPTRRIHLPAGVAYLPFTYMPGDSIAYSQSVPPVETVIFSSEEAGYPYALGVAPRQFRITPTLPLDTPAATNPVDLNTYNGRAGGLECFNCGSPRFIVAGTLVKIGATPAIAQVDAIEFYHAGFDHYFLSTDPIEINALDTGYFTGWARTGEKFRVFAAGSFNDAPVRPVCRYYGLPSAGLDSHFYSADPAECYRVNRDYGTEWQIESGNVFQVTLPNATTGACPIGTQPVYRVFNHRPDANHRYTTSTAIRTHMEAGGWIREGYGPDATIMCAIVPTD